MLKAVLKYSAVEGMAKGLNKLVILMLPFFMSDANYGFVGIVLTFELLVPFILLLGMERVILRFYNDRDKFEKFEPTVFNLVTYFTVFVVLVLAGMFFFGIESIFGLRVFPDWSLIIILAYFQGRNLLKLNIFRINNWHNAYLRNRLMFQGLKVVFVVTFSAVTKSYLGYLVGAILAAIVLEIVLNQKFKRISEFSINSFSMVSARQFLGFSWPFILHGFSGNLIGNVDKLIIHRFLSIDNVGIYTLCYAIGSVMIFAFVGVSVFMEPLIYKEKDDVKRLKLLNLNLKYGLAFGFAGFILLTLMSYFVIPLLYSAEGVVSEFYLIPVLASSYLLYPFYLKANYILIYEKRTWGIARISLILAGINIVLNIGLIPIIGLKGAALSTVISYWLQAVFFTCFVNKWRFNKDVMFSIVGGVVVLLSAMLYFFIKL